jgi:hypothetical protein
MIFKLHIDAILVVKFTRKGYSFVQTSTKSKTTTKKLEGGHCILLILDIAPS